MFIRSYKWTVSVEHNNSFFDESYQFDKPATSHQIAAYASAITKQTSSKKIEGKKINITAELRVRKLLINKREDVLAVHRKC